MLLTIKTVILRSTLKEQSYIPEKIEPIQECQLDADGEKEFYRPAAWLLSQLKKDQ